MQPGMQRCIKISAGDDFFLKRIGWATDCFQLLLFDKAYCGGSCHGLFFFRIRMYCITCDPIYPKTESTLFN